MKLLKNAKEVSYDEAIGFFGNSYVDYRIECAEELGRDSVCLDYSDTEFSDPDDTPIF